MRRQLPIIAHALLFASSLCAREPKKPDPPKKEIEIELAQSVTMRFVRIEPSEFLMGSADEDKRAAPDEKPQRRVKITKAFYLGKFEVTRGQFRVFVDEIKYKTVAERYQEEFRRPGYSWRNPRFTLSPQTDEHPVVVVTWEQAKLFCQWLQKHPKAKAADVKEVRLPTELEWEYACRAGTTTRNSVGDRDTDLQGYANISDISRNRDNWFARRLPPWDDGYIYTAPVGKFKPNPWGLFDMHGNVYEWCEDYYGPYKDLPATDPLRDKVFGDNESRVIRGGSWQTSESVCASANRDWRSSGKGWKASWSTDVGFRVLVSVSESQR